MVTSSIGTQEIELVRDYLASEYEREGKLICVEDAVVLLTARHGWTPGQAKRYIDAAVELLGWQQYRYVSANN